MQPRAGDWNGGEWKKFPDRPHVQLPGLTVNRCFALFKEG